MLNVKKLLAKILSWGGFKYDWSMNTPNTSDTWVPVLDGDGHTMKHRVIPNDKWINATKVGNYYSSGAINVVRRGNCITIDMNAIAFINITSRVTVATVPSDFRPPTAVYGLFTDMANYFLVTMNGEIQVNPMSAGTKWGTITYCI